ncbi:hypothetical protein NB706_003709 [Xanthomonas sacchari]|nr:hypothetical protein [Xanthomonas sacchari]
MYTASTRLMVSRNASLSNTLRSLALQVTHQSAVMLTNTTRLSVRRRSSICGEYATVLRSTLALGGGSRVTPQAGTSAASSNTAARRMPVLWSRQRARSNHHRPSASRVAPISSSATASTPRCLPSTHSSQIALRYIGNASTCLSVSIQAPGLGRRLASEGTKPISRNGSARPRPRVRNTSIAAAAGAVSA